MIKTFLSILRLAFICSSTWASSVSAAEFLRLPGTNSLAMLGQIESSDFEILSNFIDNGVEKVLLSSPGGSLDAAWRLGHLINDNDVEVVLADNISCASACAIMFLHSASRKMAKSAQLGVHLPYFAGLDGMLDDEYCQAVDTAVSMTLSKMANASGMGVLASGREREFNASHILLESKRAALEIIELLEAGKNFSNLAKEFSDGPSSVNGGSLGWFGTGVMVPEFDSAVQSLKIGAFSAPVKTQFGWHVIQLNNIRSLPNSALGRGEIAMDECLSSAYQLGALEFLRIGDLIRQAGVSESVLRRIVLTPSNEIYWFDYNEALSLRLISAIAAKQ